MCSLVALFTAKVRGLLPSVPARECNCFAMGIYIKLYVRVFFSGYEMNGSRLQPTKPFCINEECAIEARVLWSSGAFVTERKILLSRNPSTMVVSCREIEPSGNPFWAAVSRKTSPKKSLPINLSIATTMLPLEKGEKGSNDSPNHQSKRRASRKKSRR